jgi:uncharacterized membrane protein HdeD (DUF308 family)
MDSVVERVGQMGRSDIKRLRWALGLNGVLSLAFGIAVLVWPGISLYALVILFGAYSLAGGIIGLGAAISGKIVKASRGWLALSSLAGIAVGVLVFLYTDMSAVALLYVIGAYAIALGIIAVGGGFSLPLHGGDRALLALTGLVSILFGVVMFAKPGDGALVLLALIAAFALVRGISELVIAIGWQRLLEYNVRRSLSRAKPRPQPAS